MNRREKIDIDHIWHPFSPITGQNPIYIKKAKGSYLYTKDGRKIIDAISSWWVNIHGHAHPAIAKSVAKQAKKLEQVIFAGFTHKPAIDLTKSILKVLPGYQKVFFSDNGSTSTEVALKLGIQFWKNKEDKTRRRIIAIEGAYHGDTFGAMSLGGENTFTFPFSEYLFEVEFIPFPEGNGQNSVDKMNEIAGKGDAAVFIFEPLVQGASGMRMYEPEILNRLISIAQDNDVVTIADEVMTGFGRTGKLFACDFVDNKPDIICLSKGISGGFLPLGLTVMNQKIVDAFDDENPDKTFYHGHSFTANPIACAASVTSLNILQKKSVRKRIEEIERKQKDFVSRFEEYRISKNLVKDVRSTGTILAIELFSENPGYTSSIKEKIYRYFMERDILLRPLGNVIYLLPPYVITDNEIDSIHSHIIEFLANY